MDAWIGQPFTAVVNKYGPPASTYDAGDNKKLYTYYFDFGSTGRVNNFGLQPTLETTQKYCKVVFSANATGLVDGYRADGNSCRSELIGSSPF